jgi:hypothetical protein
LVINDLRRSELRKPLTINDLRIKKRFDFGGGIGYCISMIDYKAVTDGLINEDTCGQGSVYATFDQLVALFGEPFGSSADGKVQAMWQVKFGDGTIATIYDYKEYDTAVEDVTCWSVGGHSERAEKLVEAILRR